MSDPALSQTDARPAVSVVWIVTGIIFMFIWIGAHLIWLSMSLMGSLMANDAAAVSGGQHASLIGGLLSGQILAGVAGIPAGLAFFWRRKRKLLLWIFAITFVIGALLQGWAIEKFLSLAA